MKSFKQFQESWSNKYKRVLTVQIRKFSQAHCAGRKRAAGGKTKSKQLNEQSSYSKKTWTTSKFKSTLTFTRMKIQKVRFMDLVAGCCNR